MILGLVILFSIGVLLIVFISLPPSDYPDGTIIAISKDMSITQAATEFKAKHAIHSSFIFKIYAKVLSKGFGVKMGDYLLNEPESVLRLAYRTTHGIQGLPRIKITVPEGLASSDIARLFAKNIPDFDIAKFNALAKPFEGYLFPDTYFFYRTTTAQEVFDTMRSNFDSHVEGLKIPPNLKGVTFKDAVIMASIVEEEARSPEDRRVIAGILWKRLSKNMPLQVDPPFFYILGKTSAELTKKDLATTSPYNLYKHTGLPPTPIDNPGLDAIKATLEATSTEYYFYLSDVNGIMHYAKTYEGHLVNKGKYID